MPDARKSDHAGGALQFIVSNGPRPDASSRKTIRRQAMKEVGLNRRRRNHTFQLQSAEQDSLSRISAATDCSDSSHASSISESLAGITPHTELTVFDDTTEKEPLFTLEEYMPLHPGINFASGDYWHRRSNSTIDLSFLTILTNFNIGKTTIATLAASPNRLPTVLNYNQWSYLQFIPQRYPHSPCLAAATDCILARAEHVLSPQPGGERLTLKLYAKALRLVQSAVASSASTDPDVLCAVQLLSLSELFDTSRTRAWASHIEGSTRLIRHRTVGRFETEFEKALFAASVGPSVSECLYNGTHCYLAEPHWKDLYLSIAQAGPVDSLSERSELVLGLRSQMFTLPGLWSDVGRAIEGDDLFDDDILDQLTQRCREAQAGYIESLEEYKTHLLRTAFSQPSPEQLTLRREIYGLAHEGLILVKRLQASVCDTDRPDLEPEVRNAAQNILDMQNQPSPQHSWLFSGHELGVAQLALQTSDHFMEDVSNQSWKARRVAMRKRYMLWSDSLRAF